MINMSFEGSLKGTKSFVERTGRQKYWDLVEREMKPFIDPSTGLLRGRYAVQRRCPLCNFRAHYILFYKDGCRVVRCRRCGLVYLSYMLKEGILEEIYESSESVDFWIEVLIAQEQQDFEKFTEILEEIERYANKGELLDVGCGIGYFMKIAVDRGWMAGGIELNERAIKTGRERYGIKMTKAKIEEIEDQNRYDVVTLLDLIEHIPRPSEMLKECHRVIKPGGVLAVLTPNVESLVCRILHEGCSTFGKNHLQYYSKETLTRILEKSGFQPLKFRTIISEVNTIWNYLHYREPYRGDLKAPAAELLADMICKAGYGYRLFSLSRKI